MQSKHIHFVLGALVALCLSPFQARADLGAHAKTPPVLNHETIHGVFDAGSSGTRLILYWVAPAGALHCAIGKEKPAFEYETSSVDPIEVQGGLADMTLHTIAGVALTSADARAVRPSTFPKATHVIDYLWGKVPAPLQAKVTGLALLGTGGFRDPARVTEGAVDVMRTLNSKIAAILGPRGEGRADVAQGRDEAILAWYAARELRSGQAAHAAIEIGGQTCQYAWAGTPPEGVTADLGQNAMLRQYGPAAPGHAGDFLRCWDRHTVAGGAVADAASCIGAFRGLFAASNLVTQGSAVHAPGSFVFGMGAWKHFFNDFHRYHGLSTPKAGQAAKLSEMFDFAKDVCAGADKAAAIIGPGKVFQPANWCFRVSHAVGFAAAIRGVSIADVPKSTLTISDGLESFARGAALDPRVFAECR